MMTTDQNRINMLTTVQGVLTKHQTTWQAHVAFSEGVEALAESLTAIDAQAQVAQGNPGASDAKELARQELCTAACEVIGALRAYAAVNADPELAARVNFSASDVIGGKANEVVSRCRSVHTSASELVSSLGNYGVTTTRLTAFKRKIDSFEELKSAPRQSRVTQSAAAQLIPQLVRSAVSVLRDQLDGLVLQFKSADPSFYEEYFSARVVVDTRGGRSDNTDIAAAAPPSPLTTPIHIPVPAPSSVLTTPAPA